MYGCGNKVVTLHPPTGSEEGESCMGRDSNGNSLANNRDFFIFFLNLFLFSPQTAGREVDVGLPARWSHALMAVG